MVTHNLFQARRLSEEIFFMWEGRIIEKGETQKLLIMPRTKEPVPL